MKATKRPDAEPGRHDAKKNKTENSTNVVVLKGKDLAKKIIESEETEAETRSGDEDFELFKKTCASLQEYMQEILLLKLEPQSEDSKKTIVEKRIEASLLFVTLKKLNRLDKLRLKKARDVTHDVKQRVDSFHLQLENLLYEVFHLRKEVDKCLEFKSKDEDIDLVPVEEFYQEAPTSISKPETTSNDQHKLTLARLEWEFEQRKRLSEQCRELEVNREKAMHSITQKQKKLESLLPRLHTILEATRPLQDELSMPLEKIKYQKELAALLPDPLYILYSQIKAYSEAVDSSVQVTIEGAKEDALNYGNKTKPCLDEIFEDVDSAESDMEMEYETSKRSAPNPEIKVDSQPARHPLRIQLLVDQTCITFGYLATLNLVTVDCKALHPEEQTNFHISATENLLAGIFKNDHGDEFSWANSFQIKSLTNCKFNELGRPYLWAQKLAGIEVTGKNKEISPSFVDSDFVESVVCAIRNRIRHRAELNSTLCSLAEGNMELHPKYLALFPPIINSRIVSWNLVSYEECLNTCEHSVKLFNSMEIDPKSVIIYKGLLERDSAKLQVVAAIPIDYPDSSPIFSIELSWHGRHNRSNSEPIRNIEAELNLPDQDHLDIDKSCTLVFRLKQLCQYLDLITEVDSQLVKKEQGGWQTQKEGEFKPDKMVPQLIRGRDRLMPTKYEPNTGFFLHR